MLAYPINPSGTDTAPKTLPSGYQPLCKPCYHFGQPDPGAYHDHVLTGAPGLGKNGTAGEFKAPWKIILLVYNPAVALSPNFKPITSADEIEERVKAHCGIHHSERCNARHRRTRVV